MTLEELKAECGRVKALGLTYVMLTVAGKMPAKSDQKRLWRGGPTGRAIGAPSKGRVLVEVKADDVLRALAKGKVTT